MSPDSRAATPCALTIAGSDSGGGAGIQADLKTFAAMGVYGCSAITAVTAQNTKAVNGIWPLPMDAVAAQIQAVLSDIGADAIKLGMLYSGEIVVGVAEILASHGEVPVICDPVLVATTGAKLTGDSGGQTALIAALKEHLFPRAALLTPNIEEAALLLGEAPATGIEQMQAQARDLISLGARAVLLKGGHGRGQGQTESAVDVLCYQEGSEIKYQLFALPRITTRNTHGTGCTLSAAVAASLAKGLMLADAVATAKHYVHAALAAADQLKIGGGHGPLHHFAGVTLPGVSAPAPVTGFNAEVQ